jgi:hypothetical protein
MVWVYDSPLSEKERKAYHVLKKRLKGHDIAKDTVKVMSLVTFLHKTKFNSPKDIQESAFYDKSHTKPIFDEKSAKSIFKSMKKRGGGDSKYPFTDFAVKQGISKVGSYLPDFMVYPFQTIYGALTTPVSLLKDNVPLVDVALDAIHGATEVGVTTTADAAEAVGGPVGAAVATPFVALAGAAASGAALLEQDLGQAVAHIVNVVPLFGSAFGKGLTQMEHQVETLKDHPTIASFVPVVSDYVAQPVTAGKRFSTRKHRYNKWQRTRRTKSAKV